MGFDPQPQDLRDEIERLNLRGRGRVERRLREIRHSGNEDLDSMVAWFVLTRWRERRRAFRFAREWLKERPSGLTYAYLLDTISRRPWKALPIYLRELARADLSDDGRDDVIDDLSDIRYATEAHPLHAQALRVMVDHVHHPSPEVRWTTIFSLAKQDLCPGGCREEFERLTADETLSRYGYVSRIAKNALRRLDGDDDFDLYDASVP